MWGILMMRQVSKAQRGTLVVLFKSGDLGRKTTTANAWVQFDLGDYYDLIIVHIFKNLCF